MISKYDFGPVKLPGLSRNGSRDSLDVKLYRTWSIAFVKTPVTFSRYLKIVSEKKEKGLELYVSDTYDFAESTVFVATEILFEEHY